MPTIRFSGRSWVPNGGGEPTGELAEAITETFGGLDALKEKINAAGAGTFRQRLVVAGAPARDKKLARVISTPNQDSPIMDGHTPILGVDVWEHAYYLKISEQASRLSESLVEHAELGGHQRELPRGTRVRSFSRSRQR